MGPTAKRNNMIPKPFRIYVDVFRFSVITKYLILLSHMKRSIVLTICKKSSASIESQVLYIPAKYFLHFVYRSCEPRHHELPYIRKLGQPNKLCLPGGCRSILIHYNIVNIGNVHSFLSLRKPPYGEIFLR